LNNGKKDLRAPTVIITKSQLTHLNGCQDNAIIGDFVRNLNAQFLPNSREVLMNYGNALFQDFLRFVQHRRRMNDMILGCSVTHGIESKGCKMLFSEADKQF